MDVPEHLGDVAPEVEQCYYRVAQEALENVSQHAGADRVSVSLHSNEDGLILEIADNGLGFENPQRTAAGRFGLQGMLERAELIGGTLLVESKPGQGTTIRLHYGGEI